MRDDRRALAVLADLPHPHRSGNHLRDLQTLTLLDQLGFEVAVVAGDHAPAAGRSVGPRGTLIRRVEIAPEKTTVAARVWRLLRLFSASLRPGQPGPWALPYVDAGFPTAVAAALKEVRPEVLVLRSTLAHVAPHVRQTVPTLVLDVHDVESFLARSLQSLSGPRHRLFGAVRLAAARRSEALTPLADEIWVPTEREAEHLRLSARGKPVLVVPNGVAVPDDPPERKDRRPEFLLVGGFGYPPNEAAAIRLVEEILPLVLRTHANACVSLVGRDLSPELVDRWRDQPVEWHGVVDDLGPFRARSAALLLAYDPTTNAGTPLKVAEALADGLPVIATTNATQPLGLVDELHVANAETAEGLARQARRVLDDPEAAHARAVRGHAWALATLDPRAIVDRLRSVSILQGVSRGSHIPESDHATEAPEG